MGTNTEGGFHVQLSLKENAAWAGVAALRLGNAASIRLLALYLSALSLSDRTRAGQEPSDVQSASVLSAGGSSAAPLGSSLKSITFCQKRKAR
jgi:hypothetical protein